MDGLLQGGTYFQSVMQYYNCVFLPSGRSFPVEEFIVGRQDKKNFSSRHVFEFDFGVDLR